VFCRHNRFTADCPICSKGTVLDPHHSGARRATGRPRSTRRERKAGSGTPVFQGPNVQAGPYEDPDGVRYDVRLERVPGGVRLAEWSDSKIRKRAPVLEPVDLCRLAAEAATVLDRGDAEALARALAAEVEPAAGGGVGVSRGRTGDFKEELRVEGLDSGRLRVGRWVLRPGSGWELQDAPPMLPAARFAEALAGAARAGLLAVRHESRAHRRG
jgi:hypothetical protein